MEIIMCRPMFFDVTRKSLTNRMMNPENPPDRKLAMQQWQILCGNYRRNGLNVRIAEGQPCLEDMTFTANAGLPVRGHFILSNFLEEERQGEKVFYKKFFETVYGPDKVLSLPDDAIFEGQGDALFIDKNTLLLAYGVRTNERATEELTSLVHKLDPAIVVVPLHLNPIDHYHQGEILFYHLDTCFLYLQKINTFLVHSDSFRSEAISALQKLGFILEVTKGDAERFACNSVVVGNIIFAPVLDKCLAKEFFIYNGYQLIEHDMSEFMKSGGAVKCLTLEMHS